MRQRRLDGLRRAGRLEVEVDGEGTAVVDGALLRAVWADGCAAELTVEAPFRSVDLPASDEAPLPRHLVDAVATIAAWLEARAPTGRVTGWGACVGRPRPRRRRLRPGKP